MAEHRPEEAVDAFVGALRRSLACIVRGTAIASGAKQDEEAAVTLFPEGQDGGEPARLRTHGGEGELFFRFALQFRVVRVPDAPIGPAFEVRSSFYRYDVLDRNGGEVVVFHWEPGGRSSARTPHLHVPAARPIVLPQRADSGVSGRRTYLNRLHLPTGRLLVEDVVGFLIRDFAVVPLVAEWESVLAENGAASLRVRTW